jgi:hypothetical protein
MYPFSDGRGDTMPPAGRPCSGGDDIAGAARLRAVSFTETVRGLADSKVDELAGPASASPPAEHKGCQAT